MQSICSIVLLKFHFIRHKLLIFTQFDLKSHDEDDLFHVTWQAF